MVALVTVVVVEVEVAAALLPLFARFLGNMRSPAAADDDEGGPFVPLGRAGAANLLDLGTSDEIRSEPGADRFGRHFRGAVLRVESEILELRPSHSRPDRGLATIRSETRNQLGEIVQVLAVKLVVPRRPDVSQQGNATKTANAAQNPGQHQ